MILHRTLGSTYSQKIIALLGYTKTPWQSVIANKGMPRPVQEILVGSFARRMPFLQIGADMYCDSDMIAMFIAEQTNHNEFKSTQLSLKEKDLIFSIENELFTAVLASVKPINFITGYFRTVPFKTALAFFKDRLQLKKENPDFDITRKKTRYEWEIIVREFFKKFEEQLLLTPFLSGKEKPNLVDFTAYTHVYYMNVLNRLKFANNTPTIKEWLKRMNRFSIKNNNELSGTKAIEIAKNSTPLAIPTSLLNSANINKQVTIPFNDFLGSHITKPLQGVLKGEDDYKYIIARNHPQIGTVHIHIPKVCLGACG